MPTALAAVAGNPLPGQVPTMDEVADAVMARDTGELFLRTLTIVAWVAWASFVLSVLVEIPATIRRRPALRLVGLGPQQRLAAALVAAIVIGAAAPAVATASVTRAGPAATAFAAAASGQVYVVAPDDRLADIAVRYLGDAGRYHELGRLNGLSDPDRIAAGQRLVLPTDAVDRGARPHAAGAVEAASPAGQLAYVVARGDRLAEIADRFTGEPERYRELAETNGIGDPDRIRAGQRLQLPPDATDRGPHRNATGTVLGERAAPPPPTAVDPTQPAPPASTEPTPPVGSAAPATPAQPAPTDDVDGDDSVLDQLILFGVPLMGAGLFAALTLALLRRRRRRLQERRPVGGRIPDPAEPRIETTMRVVAQPVAVERLDQALRALSAGLADRDDQTLPDVIGVWMEADTVHTLLTRPAPDPPPPWQNERFTWTLSADAELPDVNGHLAPLPTVAAVGSRPGMHLLLDLERLGLVTVTGDARRAENLLRYLAGELACNTWSDHVDVIVAGFDADETADLIALNTDRVTAAASTQAAIDRARRRVEQSVASMDRVGTDPFVGRIEDIVADAWMPQVYLVKNPSTADLVTLQRFDKELDSAGRCTVAVVTTSTETIGRWPVHIDGNGRLSIDFLGLADTEDALDAASLSRSELGAIAGLLRQAQSTENEKIQRGAVADAASAVPVIVVPVSKTVPRTASRQQSDPTLDRDLRDWVDPAIPRPRISILGPATVEATGTAPADRPRFYTEIVVYLVTRGARGVLSDQLDEALWPGQTVKVTTRRSAMTRTRRWLGSASDGEPWLPEATTDRRYRLRDGFLLDWDLFRRLRERSDNRGPAGMSDLRVALGMVRGAPLADADIAFSSVARNPYTWLPTSDIQPHHLTSAVVDAAHRLTELCLAGGDTAGARWAVEQAWKADPYRTSDITWRDMLRVAAAEGNSAELEQVVADLIDAREAEVPEDLDSETYQVLCEVAPHYVGNPGRAS
ncbi:LysM peptidoglycan-binding domain-containing protein [Virgisporangium aurantiacum]|uniref:LysM peptidoglycan-binding domain-containing protein n=1 Tax=Virgisporangium aurantiacum TaxID=175570 RepID=UPI0019524A3F|nr:LysM domain-containing protein [Virgisporangium aurantiacum]